MTFAFSDKVKHSEKLQYKINDLMSVKVTEYGDVGICYIDQPTTATHSISGKENLNKCSYKIYISLFNRDNEMKA